VKTLAVFGRSDLILGTAATAEVGGEFGVFKYRDLFYFDTFDKPDTTATPHALNVYLIRNGHREAVCEYFANLITRNGTSDLVVPGGGFTTINGGTGNDSVVAEYCSTGHNIIIGNGGTDIILGGDATNEIYAGGKVSLSQAISQEASATPTGTQGDLLDVWSGNNTIVGGNGNDFIATGTTFADGSGGSDVVVMGPGNDTFLGGVFANGVSGKWSMTTTPTGLVPTNMTLLADYYAGSPYAQPYNGGQFTDSEPYGAGNVTVFGGSGTDLIELPNGNNYVKLGSGNSTVQGGMGNDTVIAGSGADSIFGGGGTTYHILGFKLNDNNTLYAVLDELLSAGVQYVRG
jgi:Ca2+-binding RTX toxin-like protein